MFRLLLRQMNLTLAAVRTAERNWPRMNLPGFRPARVRLTEENKGFKFIVCPVAQTWPDRACYTQRFETDNQENGTGRIPPALSLRIIGNGCIVVFLRIYRRSVSLLTGAERPIYI